jgi:hypothetical protein
MMNASTTFAHIPELLQIILELSDDYEKAVLARVSQRFFECAAPLLWQDVYGVHKLMVLVPVTVLEEIASQIPTGVEEKNIVSWVLMTGYMIGRFTVTDRTLHVGTLQYLRAFRPTS